MTDSLASFTSSSTSLCWYDLVGLMYLELFLGILGINCFNCTEGLLIVMLPSAYVAIRLGATVHFPF